MVDTLGMVDTIGALIQLIYLIHRDVETLEHLIQWALELLNEVNVDNLTNLSADGIGASFLWI